MSEQLAVVAVEMAARGAAKYLRQNGLKADLEALLDCVRAMVTIRLPEALADVKAALTAGMGAVAEQTFAASMVLAGIEAAKEAGYPETWATPNG